MAVPSNNCNYTIIWKQRLRSSRRIKSKDQNNNFAKPYISIYIWLIISLHLFPTNPLYQHYGRTIPFPLKVFSLSGSIKYPLTTVYLILFSEVNEKLAGQSIPNLVLGSEAVK